MTPQLVTIQDVELARTGRWATSTGVFDFTADDFAAAVAAERDPEVYPGAIKLGHTDARFMAMAAGEDGDPAFGFVKNLRVKDLGNGQQSLRGDLVNVPKALAELMPVAYPNRSIELGFGVRTPSGNRYQAAVLGLALLGVERPAVNGLEDIAALYSGDTAFQLAAAASSLAASCEGGRCTVLVEAMAAMPPASAPSLPAVGHTPGGEPASPGGPMPPVTDARVKELLGLEATADAESELIRLRDLARAQNPTPPVPPAAAAPTVPPIPAPVAVLSQPAPQVIPQAAPIPVMPAGAAPTLPGQVPNQPGPVPTGPAPTSAAPPAPAAPAAPAGVTPPTAAPAPVPAAPEPVLAAAAALQVPAAGVYVDPATLAQLQANAAAGAAAAQQLYLQQRESVLAAHCRAGQIAPASLDGWRSAYDRDQAGTAALLATLPVAFATSPLGFDGDPAAGAGSTRADDAAFYSAMGWDAHVPSQA